MSVTSTIIEEYEDDIKRLNEEIKALRNLTDKYTQGGTYAGFNEEDLRKALTFRDQRLMEADMENKRLEGEVRDLRNSLMISAEIAAKLDKAVGELSAKNSEQLTEICRLRNTVKDKESVSEDRLSKIWQLEEELKTFKLIQKHQELRRNAEMLAASMKALVEQIQETEDELDTLGVEREV
jgi:chromosome segregation ATPase